MLDEEINKKIGLVEDRQPLKDESAEKPKSEEDEFQIEFTHPDDNL
jgi:hypothetical protein